MHRARATLRQRSLVYDVSARTNPVTTDEEGVWFQALWEIVVTIIGGVALTCILGGAGVLYKRWRRQQRAEAGFRPRPSATNPPPHSGGVAEELPYFTVRRASSTGPARPVDEGAEELPYFADRNGTSTRPLPPAYETAAGLQADDDRLPPPYPGRETAR